MARPRAPKCRGEEGTAIVESAIIGPLFFLVIFGIIEFGLLFRDVLTLSDSVNDGARIGSVMGKKLSVAGTTGDFEIIRTVRASLGSIPNDQIERVVIFRAGAPGAGSPVSQVSTTCKTTSGTGVSGSCNVYRSASAFLAVQSGNSGYFNCAVTPGSPACNWNPTSRLDGPPPATVDYLGVYIKYRHPMLTGLFGSVVTLEEAAIVRLEPGTIT